MNYETHGQRDGRDVFTVCDPDNGELIGEVKRSNPADIDSCLNRARIFFSKKPRAAHHRSDLLHRASLLVREKSGELAGIIASEGIKTIREARSEVLRCAETLKLGAEEAKRIDGGLIPLDQVPSGEGKIGFYEQRPAGIVVGITPFNDPLNLVAHKVAPAIATGCPVIIKPHPQTPFSAIALHRIFEEAGMDEPLFQLVQGGVEAAQALVSDPRPRIVSFTGGKAGGDAVARSSGIKHLSLELGGVGVVAVAADADIGKAALAIHSGAFWAAGQNCVHAQRIIADTDIYDELRSRLLSLAGAMSLGPKKCEGTDMGPCVSEGSAQRLARACGMAASFGAAIGCGGTHEGTRFQPTWLLDVHPENPVLRDELFGPVSTLERAKGFDEILRRTAGAGDAIHSALFSNSLEWSMAFWRVAPAAAVMINDSTDFRIDAMPFGGIGSAGLGREGLRDAVAGMTEKRMMIIAAAL